MAEYLPYSVRSSWQSGALLECGVLIPSIYIMYRHKEDSGIWYMYVVNVLPSHCDLLYSPWNNLDTVHYLHLFALWSVRSGARSQPQVPSEQCSTALQWPVLSIGCWRGNWLLLECSSPSTPRPAKEQPASRVITAFDIFLFVSVHVRVQLIGEVVSLLPRKSSTVA